MDFSYAVLQYRHDYTSGECLNVGLLVYCHAAQFLSLKVRPSGGRILAAYPDLARTAFTQDLKQLSAGFEKLQLDLQQDHLLSTSDWLNLDSKTVRDGANAQTIEIKEDLLRLIAHHVMRHDASSFRWNTFGSGVTSDPSKSLEELYQRFVMHFESKTEKQSRADDEVFDPARKLLQTAGIYQKMVAHEVSSELQTVKFQHSLKNGRWHCVQPLSFDMFSTEHMERKAATWTGNLFNIRSQDRTFQVYVLAGGPSEPELRPAYERALKVLRSAPTNPVVLDESLTGELVDRLVDIERTGCRSDH